MKQTNRLVIVVCVLLVLVNGVETRSQSKAPAKHPAGAGASETAPPAQTVQASGIRFDGLYKNSNSAGGEIHFYTRFFPDGIVVMFPAESVEQAATLLTAQNPTKGTYTIQDPQIEIKIEMSGGTMKGNIGDSQMNIKEGLAPPLSAYVQGDWLFVPFDFAEVDRKGQAGFKEALLNAAKKAPAPTDSGPAEPQASKVLMATEVQTTPTSSAGDSFTLKGIVVGPHGPLANKVVLVKPIDAKTGKDLTRFVPVGDGRMEMINPKTTSNAKGAFSVQVPRSLFKETPGCAYGCTEYISGQLKLGVYTDMGDGRLSSSLEGVTIRFDEKWTTVDAGRVVLGPLK